ncbi:zinc transporter ZIP3 isoform X1 [Vespa velutina]|uniref:zinc transporter ZIP3 isoform X1 n=2 Tax=Vespa velutina TaxID=202808 RepID=UPI001FB32144|nr:zinc transporter ZIP3 isoform X1 [Vespa velutina]
MYVTATQVKIASILTIGIGSFVVSIAPACFVSHVRDFQHKLILSCVLCFGGGVLLATSILHMLPEVRESLPKYGELAISCGFLLLYFVDECVHYFWGSNIDYSPNSYNHDHGNRNRNFQVRGEYRRPHSQHFGYNVASQNVRSVYPNETKMGYQSNLRENNEYTNRKSSYGSMQYVSNARASYSNEELTFLCHGSHTEPCSDAKVGSVGLLLALTIHSILEGLAIGLQKKPAEILLFLVAVASHKFIVGFCMGLELVGTGNSTCKLALASFVFAISSVIGIGIGMFTSEGNASWSQALLPILQGLAGGTLLYVTVSEVLPRERARWHKSSRRSAGIFQFFSTTTGFLLIFLMNTYIST